MAKYVDGFVIAVPRNKIDEYRRIARKAGEVWKEYGALEYRECVGDDLNIKFGVPFTKLTKAKRGETIVFAWIVYKSRSHRDRVNAKVMQDKRISGMNEKDMPFDCKRMTWGGFKTIVEF